MVEEKKNDKDDEMVTLLRCKMCNIVKHVICMKNDKK